MLLAGVCCSERMVRCPVRIVFRSDIHSILRPKRYCCEVAGRASFCISHLAISFLTRACFHQECQVCGLFRWLTPLPPVLPLWCSSCEDFSFVPERWKHLWAFEFVLHLAARRWIDRAFLSFCCAGRKVRMLPASQHPSSEQLRRQGRVSSFYTSRSLVNLSGLSGRCWASVAVVVGVGGVC